MRWAIGAALDELELAEGKLLNPLPCQIQTKRGMDRHERVPPKTVLGWRCRVRKASPPHMAMRHNPGMTWVRTLIERTTPALPTGYAMLLAGLLANGEGNRSP